MNTFDEDTADTSTPNERGLVKQIESLRAQLADATKRAEEAERERDEAKKWSAFHDLQAQRIMAERDAAVARAIPQSDINLIKWRAAHRYRAARKAWARLKPLVAYYGQTREEAEARWREVARERNAALRRLDAAQAEVNRLRCALDGADCEHRDNAKGCRLDTPCWRCRAEKAEVEVERLAEKSVRDLLDMAEHRNEALDQLDAAEAREAKLREALGRIKHYGHADQAREEARAALSPEKTTRPEPTEEWVDDVLEKSKALTREATEHGRKLQPRGVIGSSLPPEKAIRHPAHCGCLRCAKDVEDAFGLNDESSPPEKAQRQQGAYLSTDRDAAVGENWDAIRTMSRPNNPPEKPQVGEEPCGVENGCCYLKAKDEAFEEAARLAEDVGGTPGHIAATIRAKKGTR